MAEIDPVVAAAARRKGRQQWSGWGGKPGPGRKTLNETAKAATWQFTAAAARVKLAGLYPQFAA
jgi:hypothetical protein